MVGTMVFAGLLALRLDPAEVGDVVKMLRPYIGKMPPEEFGRVVHQLARLHEETRLSFRDLENLIQDKRVEAERLNNEAKDARQELYTILRRNGLITKSYKP